jgi:hypothetical protein
MKYNFLILLLLLGILSSCEKDKTNISNADKNLYELLFVNPVIKENLFKTFNIKDYESAKIFKVIISRRNQFVRVTIYQIFYNSELEELPFGAINYRNNLFLYYNGSELIFNNSLKRKKIIEMLKKSNILLENSFSKIYDSRAVQFDISINNKIKINFPAISPFDEETKKELLWKK